MRDTNSTQSANTITSQSPARTPITQGKVVIVYASEGPRQVLGA